jgi:hypothetical protein
MLWCWLTASSRKLVHVRCCCRSPLLLVSEERIMVDGGGSRSRSKQQKRMNDEGLVVVPSRIFYQNGNKPARCCCHGVLCGRALAHFTLTHHSPLLFVIIIIITAAEVRSDTCIFRLDGECDNNLAPFCTAGMFCLFVFFVSRRLIHAEPAPRGEMDGTGR